MTARSSMDRRAEAAGMVNLMAHPMAGLASAYAIGIGLTSHMMGMWLGTVMGSAAVARRAMDVASEPAARPAADRRIARKAPAATTDAVLAEARAKVIQLSSAAERRAARKERPVSRRSAEVSPQAVPAKNAQTLKAASGIVSRKRPPEARVDLADDLKAISGIGPKLEQALNRLGISTFAGLAGLSDDDVVRIDAQLGLNGRIARDEWIAQARRNLETDRAASAAGGE